MINLDFSISNPFSDRWSIASRKTGTFKQYKAWELNTYKTSCIITIDLSLSFMTDHAGVRMMLGLFGYEVEFHMYDTRHWDDDTNTWKTY